MPYFWLWDSPICMGYSRKIYSLAYVTLQIPESLVWCLSMYLVYRIFSRDTTDHLTQSVLCGTRLMFRIFRHRIPSYLDTGESPWNVFLDVYDRLSQCSSTSLAISRQNSYQTQRPSYVGRNDPTLFDLYEFYKQRYPWYIFWRCLSSYVEWYPENM